MRVYVTSLIKVNLKFIKWFIYFIAFYVKYDISEFLSVAEVYLKEYKFKSKHSKNKENINAIAYRSLIFH